MRRVVLAAVAAAALFVPGAAQAQSPPRDSVRGDLGPHDNASMSYVVVDVRSGANGEGATGTLRWHNGGGEGVFVFTTATATCLSVNGNRAIVGFSGSRFDQGFYFPVAGLVQIVDRGGYGTGIDTADFAAIQGPGDSPPIPGPTECSSYPSIYPPDFGAPAADTGDLVVTDAPPTTYTQCRQAGWVKYGFASHADCITYVHEQARQKCIFERVAHGITTFRSKYGLGPDHDHAMRHCVRLYTGF